MEPWGSITKQEKIKSIQIDSVKDYLILENYEPYPGYYGTNMMSDLMPRSIFIVLDKHYDESIIGKIFKQYKKSKNHNADCCFIAFATITIYDTIYHAVRVKNLQCFDDIANIHAMLKSNNIELKKHKTIDANAIITISKCFALEEIEKGIYHDRFDENRYYFEVDNLPDFATFKKITGEIKNNIDNNLFDAAPGYIWKLNGPCEIIRIYDKKKELDRIRLIRTKYLEKCNL